MLIHYILKEKFNTSTVFELKIPATDYSYIHILLHLLWTQVSQFLGYDYPLPQDHSLYRVVEVVLEVYLWVKVAQICSYHLQAINSQHPLQQNMFM
jgi:hypothetical protein